MRFGIGMMALVLSVVGSAGAKVVDCQEVAERVGKKLEVPSKPMADKEVRKCVAKANVLPENLRLFIAAAFYDKNLSVREEALTKLEGYDCGNRPKCRELHELLDAHLKGMGDPSKAWKDFHKRATHLNALTKARLDSGTLPKQ